MECDKFQVHAKVITANNEVGLPWSFMSTVTYMELESKSILIPIATCAFEQSYLIFIKFTRACNYIIGLRLGKYGAILLIISL